MRSPTSLIWQGELDKELNIEDRRDEPVLKAIVLLVTAAVGIFFCINLRDAYFPHARLRCPPCCLAALKSACRRCCCCCCSPSSRGSRRRGFGGFDGYNYGGGRRGCCSGLLARLRQMAMAHALRSTHTPLSTLHPAAAADGASTVGLASGEISPDLTAAGGGGGGGGGGGVSLGPSRSECDGDAPPPSMRRKGSFLSTWDPFSRTAYNMDL